ncbi:integrase catalytic domain-containing protein [Trichonephila clavipes]|nr:integrase catalytic domain-containing protein [Trichonephila clavipes]
MLISRWWEGCWWLRESPEYWPLGETPGDSEEVELERNKLKGVNIDLSRDAPPWHLYAISDYSKMISFFMDFKRTLGRSVLKYDELYTVLCDCESIINCRLLTYVSENPEELIPLTPSMFLISNKNSNIEDIEELNSNSLNKRIKYRSKLLKDLRERFRNEYLSQLIQKHNEKESRDPHIGEVVLFGDDNKKRLFWALVKIIELIPGRDGKIQTVRLKTQHGKILRPIQRIYPLEIRSNENLQRDENKKQHNKHRKLAYKYKPCDTVAIERTQFGTGLKLRPKYLGPYEVTKVNKHDRYEIQKIGQHEGPNVTSTSADKMKKRCTH